MTRCSRPIRHGWRAFSIGLFALTVGACGDQNLFESLADDDATAAQIEAAKIAIDDGNFNEAIAILQGLCGTSTTAPTCDAETASLLASAFAGRAGVNVFDLIENSVDVGSGTTLSSLSTFSLLLSAPTPADKSDMHNAVEILAGLANPTANQNLQMAIYAMADAVVTVGVDLTNGFNPSTGFPNTVPPNGAAVEAVNATEGTLLQVADDLDLALDGLAGAGLENEDLRDDIELLEAEIDADDDGDVSGDEMQQFLANLS
jgi:hypothetical protein